MVRSLYARLVNWKAKRERAVKLGDMGHAFLWCDPKTEERWQASTRYSLHTVDDPDGSLGEALRMLNLTAPCTRCVPRGWESTTEVTA